VSGQYFSHLSPKLEVSPFPEKGGCGIVVRAPVLEGELLVLWGGRIMTATEIDPEMPNFTQRVLQVEEDLFLLQPEPVLEPADYFNHSCEPNAGFRGQIALVAMRDIHIGEEVCFDYAMCDGSPYDEFICTCGSHNCRGNITGEDWKRPDLRERYAGYYSPYLQRRIENMELLEREALKMELPLEI